MDTIEVSPIPAELMAELRAAAAVADSDARDPEAFRQACERMDRMREENRKLFGVQSIAVDLVREMRDSR